MHRSILLAAPLALAACSSSTPEGNAAAAPAPSATAAAAPDAVAAAAPADTHSAPKPGALKTFGDWAVGCDNVNSCEMASLGPDGGEFPAINMMVSRAAGPQGGITVTLLPNDGLAPKDTLTGILIDGKPVGGAFDSGDQPSVSGKAAAAIAAAMSNGDALAIRSAKGTTWSSLTLKSKTLATLSLKGASAALRYIDAQQGRAGTATAIVATGDKPATAVPDAPAAPQIIALTPAGTPFTPDAAAITAMKKQADCDDSAEGDVETRALGGGATVVLVPCGSGAYNVISAVFVARDGKVAPAKTDAVSGFTEDGEPEAVPSIVTGDFDKGVLTSYARGRGLGDCGVIQNFVWDGTMFRLSEQQEMGECRGDPNYITTWTANVSRR